MSEEVVEQIEEKEYTVTIKITNQNLSYKSDFSEPETIFWLEAVKDIILKKTFEDSGFKS
jgi:3,4-dihydroxy-2-butanone 4-phosphate synthase